MAYEQEFDRMEFDRERVDRAMSPPRAPSPGIAAVLSVLVPGLGQVYAGRMLAGAVWFVATAVAYSAVLLPGFLVHAFCIWSAYRSCERW